MTDFRMAPSPMDLPVEAFNNLADRGMLAASTEQKVVGADPQKAADYLYRKFKAGSAMLTKVEAYAIGNLLEAQAARIREIETQDEPPLPAREREIEDAIDDELDRGAGK